MRSRFGRPRGVSLVETMVAFTVLAIAMVGLAQMQVVAARANSFGHRMSDATALARDLVENVSLWRYGDARLAVFATVTSLSDPQIANRLDPGSMATLPSTARMQFGETPGDPNATVAGALGTYQGASSDVDKDGTRDFQRYWTVFALDPDGDGIPSCKFVVVVVRWKEPGYGMRQVVSTTVKTNAEVYRL